MRYVLPGMGATSAMYSGPWRELSETRFLDWPHVPEPITLAGTAAVLIEKHGIKETDTLAGSSLGGIVALEIARLVQVKEVVLVGSAMTRSEINPFLMALAPLSDITPVSLLQALAGKSAGELGRMFAQVDPAFIRASCKDLMRWPGFEPTETILRRIHGARDHVIRCPDDAKHISEGGHLIAMTHARECVAFVLET